MLGNIKFIGELGKLDLIHESILHKCIKTVRLLGKDESEAEFRCLTAVCLHLSYWKRRRESSSRIWARIWSASVR